MDGTNSERVHLPRLLGVYAESLARTSWQLGISLIWLEEQRLVATRARDQSRVMRA